MLRRVASISRLGLVASAVILLICGCEQQEDQAAVNRAFRAVAAVAHQYKSQTGQYPEDLSTIIGAPELGEHRELLSRLPVTIRDDGRGDIRGHSGR